jgi:hypothetical protein
MRTVLNGDFAPQAAHFTITFVGTKSLSTGTRPSCFSAAPCRGQWSSEVLHIQPRSIGMLSLGVLERARRVRISNQALTGGCD